MSLGLRPKKPRRVPGGDDCRRAWPARSVVIAGADSSPRERRAPSPRTRGGVALRGYAPARGDARARVCGQPAAQHVLGAGPRQDGPRGGCLLAVGRRGDVRRAHGRTAGTIHAGVAARGVVQDDGPA